MVNPLFEGEAHEYWAKKQYWSLDDILNICWFEPEGIPPTEEDNIKKIKDILNQAVASGELKQAPSNDAPLFRRDDIIRWASQKIPEFPFKVGDFEVVKRKTHPGSSREDTQLRAIGAMALLLAKEQHVYQIGERPNNKAIAEAAGKLLDHLQAENLNLSGLKSANLRTFISKGIELLFE